MQLVVSKDFDINARFPNFHHCGVPRFAAWSKFSANGITIDPRPVLGEPIPQGCLYLLVWIPSSHGVQSSACADVNIWSGNEKERPCWRDGRGIREIREKMGEKIGRKMGEEIGGKMGEKMGGEMGRKDGKGKM